MQLITGTRRVLRPELMADLGGFRHRVFVEKLGWQLRSDSSLEFDQFDREDTVYVVVRNEEGGIVGTSRLLPTDRPYLLKDVFSDLLVGVPLPDSHDVWELSRFAAIDFQSASQAASGPRSSPIARALFIASIIKAKEMGAKELVAISGLGAERLLARGGIKVHRMSPPIMVDGHIVCVCSIDCKSIELEQYMHHVSSFEYFT